MATADDQAERSAARDSDLPSPEQLQRYAQSLSIATSHPEFLKALEEVATTPDAERSGRAAELLSPEALAERGVPLPEGTRITSRYFEDPQARTMQNVRLGTLDERPNILDELSQKNPQLVGDLARIRPDVLQSLAEPGGGIAAKGITICASVGTPIVPVCVSVGGEVNIPWPELTASR